MDNGFKYTDLTFFTNEENNTLADRFKAVLKTVEYFDILVGYFRINGFYRLFTSFETHYQTKEIIREKLIKEIELSEDTKKVESGIMKFLEWLKNRKTEIKVHPSRNLYAKVYISR